MTITLNWGILGAGNISSQFVHDLLLNNQANESDIQHIVRSIGSTSREKGQKFIASNKIDFNNNFGVGVVSQNYDEFFANNEVDIVYVGTPHPFHCEQVTRALESDKHVLCEKPFTINSKELKGIIDLAKSRKKFLMEAVWTRFFPSIELIKQYVFEDGLLGKINRLFADFAFNSDIENLPETSRLRDINLGGGTLLDIGIYTITYARILMDEKLGKNHTKFEMKSFLTLDSVDKVDYCSTVLLKYENGTQGILTSSNYTDGRPAFVRLEGSEAFLEMFSDNPAKPKKFKITFKDGRDPIEYEDTSDYHGFIYEANAIARDIHLGKLESSVMPLDESILVMSMLDDVRKENNFAYPQDE